MGLKTTGFDALGAQLESMAAALPEEAKKDITLKAAQPILRDMAANAPGSIGAAVRAKPRGRSGKVTIGVHRGDWKDKEYYPPYVEYGHSGPAPAPPHPFIRPAFDANRDEASRAIKEGILEALDGGK